jgi:Tfp pilus assembly protein PilV
MSKRNEQGYSILDTMMAGLILVVVLIPLVNLQPKIVNLTASAEKYNTAIFLAQGKIEEMKAMPYDRLSGELPRGENRFPFNGYENYIYTLKIDDEQYGLKTITVTVFYQEARVERNISLIAERHR